MKLFRTTMGVAVIALAASAVQASLVGSAAPPLSITDWVKGEKVDLAAGQGKHVYLVEIWRTWCGPCVAGMPHLTELQKKYEKDGLIIIGVTTPDDRGNNLDSVKAMVQDKGEVIGYRIAYDGDGKTQKDYFEASRAGGYPHAYIVGRDGKIVWEGTPGDPAANMDGFLEEYLVASSKYDPATYKKVVQVRELKNKYFALAISPSNKGTVRTLGKQIISLGAALPAEVLCEFAHEIIAKTDLKVRELDQAEEAAKKAVESSKGQDAAALNTYAHALFANKKAAEAVVQQQKALDLCKDAAQKSEWSRTLQTYQVAAGGK